MSLKEITLHCTTKIMFLLGITGYQKKKKKEPSAWFEMLPLKFFHRSLRDTLKQSRIFIIVFHHPSEHGNKTLLGKCHKLQTQDVMK